MPTRSFWISAEDRGAGANRTRGQGMTSESLTSKQDQTSASWRKSQMFTASLRLRHARFFLSRGTAGSAPKRKSLKPCLWWTPASESFLPASRSFGRWRTRLANFRNILARRDLFSIPVTSETPTQSAQCSGVISISRS